jgi:hypothetical protein
MHQTRGDARTSGDFKRMLRVVPLLVTRSQATVLVALHDRSYGYAESVIDAMPEHLRAVVRQLSMKGRAC